MKCRLMQEDDVPVPENSERFTLPGTFHDVVCATINHFRKLGFICSDPIELPDTDAIKFHVGDRHWARTVYMHPEDRRDEEGPLLYLLLDKGPKKLLAVWLKDMLSLDLALYHFVPREHRSDLLAGYEEVQGYAI